MNRAHAKILNFALRRLNVGSAPLTGSDASAAGVKRVILTYAYLLRTFDQIKVTEDHIRFKITEMADGSLSTELRELYYVLKTYYWDFIGGVKIKVDYVDVFLNYLADEFEVFALAEEQPNSITEVNDVFNSLIAFAGDHGISPKVLMKRYFSAITHPQSCKVMAWVYDDPSKIPNECHLPEPG